MSDLTFCGRENRALIYLACEGELGEKLLPGGTEMVISEAG